MATDAGRPDDAARLASLRDAVVAVIEDCIATSAAFEVGRRRLLLAFAGVGNPMPVDGHGRRPKFFSDVEVRERLVALHREVSVATAVALLTDEFGASRTPSRSAISRFWIYLDRLSRETSR